MTGLDGKSLTRRLREENLAWVTRLAGSSEEISRHPRRGATATKDGAFKTAVRSASASSELS